MKILGCGAVIGDKEVLNEKPSPYTIKCTSEGGLLYVISADNFISRMRQD